MKTYQHNRSPKPHARLMASLWALTHPEVQIENEAWNKQHSLKKWNGKRWTRKDAH
jgi:hypothetical protein